MPTVRLSDIVAARQRIAGGIHRTPLERSHHLSEAAGCDVFLKLECWQRTRSFKARGALNATLALDPAARGRGLVAASAGNHGQGVALSAQACGVPATIFVPATAPLTKQERIRALGAALMVVQGTYDDAEVEAAEYARAAGSSYVHAFDDPDVVAGQGTVGLEILEELPGVRDVVVPVGGGGLLAGIGAVVRAGAGPHARVIGAQSVRTDAMFAAFQAGGLVRTNVVPTLADGLAGATTERAYQRARAVVDDIALVSEAGIASAIRMLFRVEGVVAEGAGAVAVAALLEGRLGLRGPAVLVVSGGNIDGDQLAVILASA